MGSHASVLPTPATHQGDQGSPEPQIHGEQPSPGMLLSKRKFGFFNIRCPVGRYKPLTHILPFALPGSDSQLPQGVI